MSDLEKRFQQDVAKMKSSQEFQNYCWQVYTRNKEIVKEFVKTRQYLNITPGSRKDTALGLVFAKVKEYHSIRWKRFFRAIVRGISKIPTGHWETYLMVFVNKYELRHHVDSLSGKSKQIFSEDLIKKSISSIEKFIPYVQQALKDGKIIPLTGPNADMLPDWYFIARPENEFYKSEQLERIIVPLINKEIAADHEKAHKLVELHRYMATHVWEPFFKKQVEPILGKLKKEVEEEIRLREHLKREKDIKEARQDQKQLEKAVRHQKALLQGLNRVMTRTNIPSKEIQDKVEDIIKDINEIIRIELK